MGVRVRVKNFQSIREADLYIEGLSVVTGPNNSGKTALLRAVRGVFTNPAAGPLVRYGAAYLSVELVFDDGTRILWEKGWEKPHQKGAGVNRYEINGIPITTVGRGVPPEVESLGVREIRASSERVWPQIAQQFVGTLFLVNRPGSAVAEALSDVEKVGKLTRALKLSEKDRRSVSNELKVRRKDVQDLEAEVSNFDGFDEVKARVERLVARREGAQEDARALKGVKALRAKLRASREDVSRLRGFDVSLPPDKRARDLQILLRDVRALSLRRVKVQRQVQVLVGAPSPDLPDPSRAQKLAKAVGILTDLRTRWKAAQNKLNGFEGQISRAAEAAQEASEEVTRLLGDRGFCPTCKTVHKAGAHA